MSKKQKEIKYLDPLYVIFEKHLYEFPHKDLDLFLSNIVTDYLNYLRNNRVIIPDKTSSTLWKDLTDEVYDMFMKRIHGCLDLKEFQNSGRVTKFERLLSKDRYFKLTGTDE